MSNIHRPNYAAGIELDGPYRRTPAHRAQCLRLALAKVLTSVLASVRTWGKS